MPCVCFEAWPQSAGLLPPAGAAAIDPPHALLRAGLKERCRRDEGAELRPARLRADFSERVAPRATRPATRHPQLHPVVAVVGPPDSAVLARVRRVLLGRRRGGQRSRHGKVIRGHSSGHGGVEAGGGGLLHELFVVRVARFVPAGRMVDGHSAVEYELRMNRGGSGEHGKGSSKTPGGRQSVPAGSSGKRESGRGGRRARPEVHGDEERNARLEAGALAQERHRKRRLNSRL